MKTFAIERIRELLEELKEFDSHDLKDIILTENGKTIPMSAETLDSWRFIGLSNQSFVEFEYWKEEPWVEL